MHFAWDILKVWPTNGPPSSPWTNLPGHLFLGVGPLQKIGPNNTAKINNLILHQSGGAGRLGTPPNKLGGPIANPNFFTDAFGMWGLGTPQNMGVLARD